jgi:hypothetical protein
LQSINDYKDSKKTKTHTQCSYISIIHTAHIHTLHSYAPRLSQTLLHYSKHPPFYTFFITNNIVVYMLLTEISRAHTNKQTNMLLIHTLIMKLFYTPFTFLIHTVLTHCSMLIHTLFTNCSQWESCATRSFCKAEICYWPDY